jgi:hypothetical protein
MNVEIVEFYPSEKNEEKGDFKGTLRIKLPDIGIHILGVLVSQHNGFWFFSLPGRKSRHHKTGEEIRYPFIGFEDREQQKELIAAIREKGRAFIESRLADTTNPIVWPQQKANKSNGNSESSSQKQKAKGNDNSAAQKEKPIAVSTKEKVWITPPPIKKKAFNAFGGSRLK